MRYAVLLALLSLCVARGTAHAELRFQRDDAAEQSWSRGERYYAAARAAGAPTTGYWDLGGKARVQWVVQTSGTVILHLVLPPGADPEKARALAEELAEAQGIAKPAGHERQRDGALALAVAPGERSTPKPRTWQRTTTLAAARVVQLLGDAGWEDPSLVVEYFGVGTAWLEGASAKQGRAPRRLFFFLEPSAAPRDITLRFGLRPNDVWFIPLMGLLALLGPVGIVTMASRSLPAGIEPPVALYRLERLASLVGGLFPLAWIFVSMRLDLAPFTAMALGPVLPAMWLAGLVVVGPMVAEPVAIAAVVGAMERRLFSARGGGMPAFERVALPLMGGALPLIVLMTATLAAPVGTARLLGLGSPGGTIALLAYFVLFKRVVAGVTMRRLERQDARPEEPEADPVGTRL